MADLQPCGARLHSGLATAESVHPFGVLACERPAPVLIIIVKLKSGRFVVGAQPVDEGLAPAFHPASNVWDRHEVGAGHLDARDTHVHLVRLARRQCGPVVLAILLGLARRQLSAPRLH